MSDEVSLSTYVVYLGGAVCTIEDPENPGSGKEIDLVPTLINQINSEDFSDAGRYQFIDSAPAGTEEISWGATMKNLINTKIAEAKVDKKAKIEAAKGEDAVGMFFKI